MESRTQGSRPRTQKKSEAKAKNSLSEDRHSRGQGQECSRPRPRTKDTSASALQKKKRSLQKFFKRSPKKKKKKNRSSQKFFKRSPQKKVFQKNFQALLKILTIQKIVLSSSRGQANFRGLEASRPRTWPSRPRPRTSKCVLEDSTSDWNNRRSRRVFFRFYAAIFKLMSARFQAFAYNSRTIWSSYMKFWQQFETIDLHVRIKFWCNWLRDFVLGPKTAPQVRRKKRSHSKTA